MCRRILGGPELRLPHLWYGPGLLLRVLIHRYQDTLNVLDPQADLISLAWPVVKWRLNGTC